MMGFGMVHAECQILGAYCVYMTSFLPFLDFTYNIQWLIGNYP
jgi:hypothetical protein